MRCRGCEHPLWGLKPGPCPECGMAFKPSDYRFFPGSVKFVCPGCAQHYYGTSQDGHLEPRSFVCVGCSNALTMDEMVVEQLAPHPADPSTPGSPQTPALPTLIDDAFPLSDPKLSRWSRIVRTWNWSLYSPDRLLRSTPLDATPAAWWYLLGSALATFVASMLASALIALLTWAVVGVIIASGGVQFGSPCSSPPYLNAPAPSYANVFTSMVSIHHAFWTLVGALLSVGFVVVQTSVVVGVLRLKNVRNVPWARAFQVYAFCSGTAIIGALGGLCCPLALVGAVVPVFCAARALPAAMAHLRSPDATSDDAARLATHYATANLLGGCVWLLLTSAWWVFALTNA